MAVTRAGRRPASPAAAAVGDAATTALFVLFSSMWGEATARLAPAAGVSAFVAGLLVLAGGLAVFDPVARAVGAAAAGAPALWNPAHTLALTIAGRGPSLRAAALRAGAQVAGGVSAALAAAALLPAHALPSPAVPGALKTAFLAELGLGAVLALAVIVTSTSKSRLTAVGVPLGLTVLLTVIGAEFASHAPAFNPAVAAAWSWRALPDLARHAAAYWAAPLAGGAIAGVVWRILDEDDGRSRKGRSAGKARASRAASQRVKRA